MVVTSRRVTDNFPTDRNQGKGKEDQKIACVI